MFDCIAKNGLQIMIHEKTRPEKWFMFYRGNKFTLKKKLSQGIGT